MNEFLSNLKHQDLYPSGTTVTVEELIINGVIEERINRKDRLVKVRNFPGAIVTDRYGTLSYSNNPRETW